MLRKAGDFPNKSVVEFATIIVSMPNAMLPLNVKYEHWDIDDETIVAVSVGPSGKLSYKLIILESIELAEEFVNFLKIKFEKREYKGTYNIEVKVDSSTSTKTITKLKENHSESVRSTLKKHYEKS